MANPYDILGVNQRATQDEIKSAYRQLAKKYHPDLNAQDPDKVHVFQKVNLAYELLSDEQLRRKYDEGVIDGFGREIRKKQFHQEDYSFDSTAFYEVLKRELQRRKKQKERPPKPKEYNFTLKLTFLEAVKGCEKVLNINDEKQTFTIPAGVFDGQILNFKDHKNDSTRIINIMVFVANHHLFKRKENNIIVDLPITIKEAISGGTIDIPTIHDQVSVRLAPHVRSGTLVKLKGKGILNSKIHEYGDQYTYIQMVLPDTITPEFKTTIETLEDKYPYHPREIEIKKK